MYTFTNLLIHKYTYGQLFQVQMYNVQMYNEQKYNVQMYNVQMYNIQMYNVQMYNVQKDNVLNILTFFFVGAGAIQRRRRSGNLSADP